MEVGKGSNGLGSCGGRMRRLLVLVIDPIRAIDFEAKNGGASLQ